MNFYTISFIVVLTYLGLSGSVNAGEDVDVVEAISGSDTDHHLLANDREDSSPPLKSDQLALESIGDHPDPGNLNTNPKHSSYSGPPPPPPPPNPSRSNNRPGGPQHKNFNNNNPKQQQQPVYNGPPPPQSKQAMDKYGSGAGDLWPAPVPDMPKIISLDVKCEKNLMKVYIGFDKPFYGIVFSKGHYSNAHCVHLPAGLGRTSAHFEIGIHACGTSGNTENGLYGYGAESGSGTFFENIIVIQYDPQVQEVWDQARKLRCTWHDQYEKSVTFRPFPVDMLDVVRTDFAGDNVGCWMQIQVGKGPWASEVSGLVKIGQTMTMVLAIKDDDSKFDMLVRNCMAHDGKRAPIQLVDQKGCVTRPKLMSRFTKIKNFGASASVLSYAHFQAFKFPDSMEVHFQCTIQICRYQCPDQCSEHSGASGNILHNGILDVSSHSVPESSYGQPALPSLEAYLHHERSGGRPRDERRARRAVDPEKEVGVNRIIRVVSTGDLTFSIDDNSTTTTPPTIISNSSTKDELNSNLICMTTPGFAVTLVLLLAVLIVSCLISAFLYVRLRPYSHHVDKQVSVGGGGGGGGNFGSPIKGKTISTKSCFYS